MHGFTYCIYLISSWAAPKEGVIWNEKGGMVNRHKGLEVLGLIAVATTTLSFCAKCKTNPSRIPLVCRSCVLA